MSHLDGAHPNVTHPDVGTLVALFEESEDATLTARNEAERDRDYYDGKQLTAAEKSALAKRGQPEIVINRMKRKIDFLVGVEKTQRVRPQALPRTPVHEHDAEAASQALRFVTESEDYSKHRLGVWKNMLIEGCGGLSVGVAEEPGGSYRIDLKRVAWDRLFADPHASELDFADAKYKGVVVWMDIDDAFAMYPHARDALEHTLATSNPHDTYDDKPKYRVWADAKRKRVRIVEIWVKRADRWFFYEFTYGGILKGGPSPYITDTGLSDCPLIFQSAYVDRDNNRYGIVREMLGPQDEINKRRSKSLHLLNTKQIMYRKSAGAIDDIERVRKEAARPDGVIAVEGNPNNPLTNDVQVMDGSALAAAQLGMLQEAKNEIDLMGPNGTMLGDNTGGPNAASGRAILASQQGGMMQIGDLLDHLRHFDRRVFRAIWYRIRQFWAAEKWVRVTDDERNVKWVGVNVDPARLAALAELDPQAAAMIAGAVGNLAKLDCDIVMDDAPDGLTPQLEQFEALVNLKQFDANNELPFRAILRAAPNLKNKDQIFAEMDRVAEEGASGANLRAELELRGAEAELARTQAEADNVAADTALKRAKAAEAIAAGGGDPNLVLGQPPLGGMPGGPLGGPLAGGPQGGPGFGPGGGPPIGPNGLPLGAAGLGPAGRGPEHIPIGPDGLPIGPDGLPFDLPIGPDGLPLGPDGLPLGPDGLPLGPDGLGPEGLPIGPDGLPVGPDGLPLGPGFGPLGGLGIGPGMGPEGLNPENIPIGPEGLGPDGLPLGPDGLPLEPEGGRGRLRATPAMRAALAARLGAVPGGPPMA